MSSIKDFKPTSEQKTTPTEEELNQTKADYSDLVELFLTRYGDLSEEELISEMLKLIEQKKQEGTYNPTQLKELAKKVEPFLDYQQKQKMEELLKLL